MDNDWQSAIDFIAEEHKRWALAAGVAPAWPAAQDDTFLVVSNGQIVEQSPVDTVRLVNPQVSEAGAWWGGSRFSKDDAVSLAERLLQQGNWGNVKVVSQRSFPQLQADRIQDTLDWAKENIRALG